LERRDFVKTAAGASLLVLGKGTAASEPKSMETMLKGRVFETEHSLPPLPFQPGKLKGLSEKLIQSHWENNFGGSVKTLNAVRKKLAEALANKDTPPFVIGGLKREHLSRVGSVVFHELYFGNLGGNGKCGDTFQKKLAKDLGSFESWELEFRKTAQSLGGGSGWVVLGYNFHLKTLENYWSWDHMHAPVGTAPLLVMDMYEHSYQMDYGAAVTKYIEAFFKNIQWEKVEERFEKAAKFQWT
jgi:superoxide dismutase, Fe-Mn family